MNKPTLLIPTIFSIGIGSVLDFFVLRRILYKINKPRDRRQQINLAAGLAVLLTIPSIMRIRQLEALGEVSQGRR